VRGTPYRLDVRPRLPERIARLAELAGNLWYSWHRATRTLFAQLDQALWTEINHSPKTLLHNIAQRRLEEVARDAGFVAAYDAALAAYDAYHAPRAPDARFAGFDAAALVETIEHIDAHRLSSVERAVFGSFRPATVVITTPNSEYNPIHGAPAGSFRHPDHRFEWPRAKFRDWARGVAGRNGYRAAFGDIGEPDPDLGSPTQMAVLSRAV